MAIFTALLFPPTLQEALAGYTQNNLVILPAPRRRGAAQCPGSAMLCGRTTVFIADELGLDFIDCSPISRAVL